MTQRRGEPVMRVLHLIDSGGFFGAEQVIVTLAREQLDHQIVPTIGTIVAPADNGDPLGSVARSLELPNHQFIMEDGFKSAGLRAILRYIKENRPDVVHCHGYKANILMAVGAPSNRNWRLVTTLHGWVAKSLLTRLGVYEAVERFLLWRFDVICAVNSRMIGRLPAFVRWYSHHRIISNGVTINDECLPCPDDIEKFVARRRAVVAVGRLSVEKDYATLIEAVAILKSSGCTPCLVIVGDGPQKENLEKKILALGLDREILLAGYRQSPRDWIHHFEILAISSITEGLPMVLLEALAQGLPVVSTRVGAIPDVLGQTDGVLVSPRCAQELADGLLLQLRKSGDASDRNARREFVARNFGSTKMLHDYTDAYTDSQTVSLR